MEFNLENIYIILEDFFEPANNRVLLETKSVEIADIENQINLNGFVGKGVGIYGCDFMTQVFGKEDKDYDFVLEKEKAKYGFQINEILRIHPLVEGEFTPGIYKRESQTQFYKLEDIESFSDEYSDTDTIGAGDGEYKLVCTPDSVEIVILKDNQESLLETVIRHPFTYFDLFCPICSKQFMECEPFADGSRRCWMREINCGHYVGSVEMINSRFIKTDLDELESDYKLEGGQLYLMTDKGWRKPFIYIPSYDPVNSFWSKSGGENYSDVFLFFE